MLVLTRSHRQSVHIGDDIMVTVLEIRGDKIRLGFEAPRSIEINRREVWLQLRGLPPDNKTTPEQTA